MKFEEWFEKQDFWAIEAMKEEVRPEYYCRYAWFAQEYKTLELIQELASLRPCKETAGVGHLVKKAKELLK